MNDCPLIRSLGKIVQDNGKPFAWIPGEELPFFGRCRDAVQIATDESQVIYANRVEDGVPIFTESVNVSRHAYALAAEGDETVGDAPVDPPPALAPHDVDGGQSSDADREGEEPIDRMRRLAAEAESIKHKLWHFPKNPACPICNRSRMYRKKVRRFRPNPWEDRGALEPTTAFVQRIATDFIILQKLSGRKEHAVQVIRDEYSGFTRAFPMFKQDMANVSSNILSFGTRIQ